MNVRDLTFEDWKARRAALVTNGRAFIGGAYVGAKSGETFARVSPVDGSHLADIARCGAADENRASADRRRQCCDVHSVETALRALGLASTLATMGRHQASQERAAVGRRRRSPADDDVAAALGVAAGDDDGEAGGECDRARGECQCVLGFGASDGDRGPGPIEDCGWREPVLKVRGYVRGKGDGPP